LDPLGHIVSWNAGAERLKGYSASEVLGKHFSDFTSRRTYRVGGRNSTWGRQRKRGSARRGLRIRKDGSRFGQASIAGCETLTESARDSQTHTGSDRASRGEIGFETSEEELELRVEQRAAVLAKSEHELREEIGNAYASKET